MHNSVKDAKLFTQLHMSLPWQTDANTDN